MSPAALAAFTGVGLAVGFTAGLVGIGGGVLMVPFLYFVYDTLAPSLGPGWVHAAEFHATIAHATSLFVIVPTAALGAWSYHRSALVSWRAAVPIGIASVFGGIAGANVAILLPAAALKLAFGVFLLFTAMQLRRERKGSGERPMHLSLWATVPVGLAVGVFSALLGVGGGLVAIPLLLYVVGLPIEKVAATSLAVIAFAASGGTLTYMVRGSGITGLPTGSIGFVHMIAGLPLILGSVFTVRLGADVNQRMNVSTLRAVFSILLLVLGARLVLQSMGLFTR
jgi:uncharacterized membrane protein YfcA